MSVTQMPIRDARARETAPVAETIEWFVDNADGWQHVIDAIARANRSIWITQLAFDADCRAWTDDGASHLLLDGLVEAAARGVAVRILLNETFLLDTATPLRKHLRRIGATNVIVRGISHFPQLIHAKMLIVDEREATLIGSPFVNGYWDDGRHAPTDVRRPARELGGRPLHDLSFTVTGRVVGTLAATFASLWNDGSIGNDDDGPLPCCPARGAGQLRVTRTAGRNVLPEAPDGADEILTSIEDAIASARCFIYIEHQYLSSVRVIAALARALEREPALEIVAVLNQNPDVTAYRVWQNTRLRDAGLLDHPRVGLFALWTASAESHGWVMNQVFVHSKVLIVDDAWLTAGSANLDGVSLHSYGADFTSRLGERVFRHVRNLDVNIALHAVDEPSRQVIATLLARLWREHLALPAIDPATTAFEGRLALWRQRARENVSVLDGTARGQATMVLPYSTSSTPVAQLRDNGIRTGASIDLRFDPSWLEVHCSPNWIRNMFA